MLSTRGVKTLLDYGAGKTQQYSPFPVKTEQGQQSALLKQVFNLDEITCYDPGYTPIASLPKNTFDCVVCNDVLDRCPEEDLPWVVSEIFSFAKDCVFIKVNDFDNGVRLSNNEADVITQKPKEWWVDLLSSAKVNYPSIAVYAFVQQYAQGQADEITSLIV